MSYRGLYAWPPVWVRRGGEPREQLRGEIGILKEVIPALIGRRSRIFLVIEHEGNEYMGCLMLGDRTFCGQISNFLKAHRNRTIEYIGSLDLSLFF